MKYKRYIFPILMGFSMSNVMSLAVLGAIKFPAILTGMLIQACVASIASLIVPIASISARLTKKYFPKLSGLPFIMVSSIIPAVFFTAIMSITGLMRIRGYTEDFWSYYFRHLPEFTLYAYGLCIFWNMVLDGIIRKVSEK